jgi:hypothetical protein
VGGERVLDRLYVCPNVTDKGSQDAILNSDSRVKACTPEITNIEENADYIKSDNVKQLFLKPIGFLGDN